MSRFRPRVEVLEARDVPTAVVFLVYDPGLSAEVKARIKEVMHHEFSDAGADILVTDDPLVGENATKVVQFLDGFASDFGVTPRWGDAEMGGRNARVFVKEFTDDPGVSGEFNTTEKLGNAIGETAAHEVGHTFGCNHNKHEPNDKMTEGGEVTPAERAGGNRLFSDEDKVILRRNAGTAGDGPLLKVNNPTVVVVAPVPPVVQPPSKPEDGPHIDAALELGGQFCNQFHLGILLRGPDGTESFQSRTSLNFFQAFDSLSLFNGEVLQWTIEGQPGTAFDGQRFTAADAKEFELSDPVSGPTAGREVFRRLDVSWDVNDDGTIDVFFSTTADPALTHGFVRVDPAVYSAVVTGTGAGGGPHVLVRDAAGRALEDFFPFGTDFRGGVRVAAGDITGDGIPDVIAGTGPGAGPHVRAFDGHTGAEVRSFFAFDAGFTGGLFLAAGDVTGDGFDDIVVAAGPGAAPHVKVFSGATGAEVRSFFAYDASYRNGVNLSCGDTNGDGFVEVITGAGEGAAPHVKVFDGRTGGELRSFFAYGQSFLGGVNVGSGDVNGDGFDDIITGTGPGAGPHVKVFNGRTGAELHSFFAFTPTVITGVRVGATDRTADGRADVVTGVGAGLPPHVKVFGGPSLAELDSFFAYDAGFLGGVYVAGPR